MQKYNETEQILAKPVTRGEMSFADALVALQNGNRVARAGWNGRGQWVAIIDAMSATLKDDPETTCTTVRPHLALKTVQGDFTIGWIPSTGDLFADDWFVIK